MDTDYHPNWPSVAPEVLSVGLSTVDHLWRVERFPPSGSRTPAHGYESSGGGPAATAAVAAARLGAHARLWSNLGDDPAGSEAMAELRRFGVDVSQIRRLPGSRTAVSAVMVNPNGERHIFPFFGDALREATLADFDDSTLVGVGSVLVDLRIPALTAEVLERARAASVPSVGDVSNTRNLALTHAIDHLIASQECAVELLGRDDPVSALGLLRQRHDQVVGITLGGDGLLLDDGDGPQHVPSFTVDVVDTTGAGDVFHGAYAFGVACGWAPLRCAQVAAATAALACTGVGRSAIPGREAVSSLLTSSATGSTRAAGG